MLRHTANLMSRVIAVGLMLVGVVMIFAGTSSGLAIAIIAVGIAIVAINRRVGDGGATPTPEISLPGHPEPARASRCGVSLLEGSAGGPNVCSDCVAEALRLVRWWAFGLDVRLHPL